MIEQQEFHWPHVDASRELLWQVTGVVVSKQDNEVHQESKVHRVFTSLDSWMISKSTWPLTHVYDPAFRFVRFDMIWQLLVKFRQEIQLHFCRTGRFSSFCVVRHLHHHLVWCKSEHAWKQYDFCQGGRSTSDPKREAQANPRPSSQHKLGNIFKNKTQQHTSWTNDRKQNKIIEILSPEWWL